MLAPAAGCGQRRAWALDALAVGVGLPLVLLGLVRLVDLVGLGAQQWRTRSGYAGLTVFFWDLAARRWATWSDSRPAYYASVQFDPAQRYSSEGAWPDAPAARGRECPSARGVGAA